MDYSLPLTVVAGVISWSFLEYALHNWYGHKSRGKNKFSRDHLAHHANTNHFASTALKAMLAAAVLIISSAITVPLIGWTHGLIYSFSLIGFYSYYEFLHRRMHTHAPKGKYRRFITKLHFYHHYGNTKMNHGVTSPLWDIVFGTYVKADKVMVPERNPMFWLLDENNQVKEIYKNDYELLPMKRFDKNANYSEKLGV